MENQHRKISGYRELSQTEIDLMNRIKAAGAEILGLHEELVFLLADYQATISDQELNRFSLAEPLRWAAIGKTDIQTGIMALVRAVAQPAGV